MNNARMSNGGKRQADFSYCRGVFRGASTRPNHGWRWIPVIAVVPLLFSAESASAEKELMPTSQFARLGYEGYGRAMAAASDTILVAALQDTFIKTGGFISFGDWVEVLRFDGVDSTSVAGLFPVGGDSSDDHIYDRDDFGASVSVSPTGMRAVVGAPLHDELAKDAGAVHVFSAHESSWFQVTTLFDFDGAQAGDRFGAATAMSGGFLAVGAPGNASTGDRPGAIRLYELCNWFYCFEQTLRPPEGVRSVGRALATDGNTLVAGALLDPKSGPVNRNGVVLIYSRDPSKPKGEQWELARMIQPDGLTPQSQFGATVVLDSDPHRTIVVGAPGQAVGEQRGKGTAFVYRQTEDDWVLVQRVFPPVLDSPFLPADASGQSLALADGVLLVGSNWTPENPEAIGSAHAFRFDGSLWIRTAVRTPPAGSSDRAGVFGTSVAVSHGQAVVGAPGREDDHPVPGAVFRFPIPVSIGAGGSGESFLDRTERFVGCLTGPLSADHPVVTECAGFDENVDGDVDLLEAAIIQRAPH